MGGCQHPFRKPLILHICLRNFNLFAYFFFYFYSIFIHVRLLPPTVVLVLSETQNINLCINQHF